LKQSILNILNLLPPGDRERINRVRIAEAMLKLPARDRAILRMRFGLDGEESMTQAQIAKALGMTQQAVSWRLRHYRKLGYLTE
jgi:RNA polymerase sigma factor (sigma-70 family)